MKHVLPDVINGCFEALAAISVWMNVVTVRKDKEVRGVYGLASLFFALWGTWNCYYYPSLDQWWSFFGGLFICIGNFVWVYYYFKYRKN